ncbi:uncharacterized protein BP5553_03668 [Venustampulla echinocandica]|uniref:Uncharacterized protein n=1 Tax=Venustampulla echinocandica TaxID=2656787 RepID=A0A370TV25_9HELO|nr:uncharacterized protein BP5553_03668 [Venustampulla echinocandica]RDL39328.1 hypothetical protein BP5553_03668 [Venustampulla echinocandica]
MSISPPPFPPPILRRDSRRVSRMLDLTPSESDGSPSNVEKPAISFGFHIEGVLMRSWLVLYGAKGTLQHLRKKMIPFFLFTETKEETTEELSYRLGMEFDNRQVIPLHHPFYDIVAQYTNKNILVLGGVGDSIRDVAREYGLKKVFTSWDLYKRAQFPDELSISAIFVLSNPRDWKLDSVVAMGLLLSKAGYIGSMSSMNGNNTLPNKGYGQFQQPHLYWCNPDSTSSFKGALESVWSEETGGADMLRVHMVQGPLPPPKVPVTYDIKYIPGNDTRPSGGGVKATVEWALKDAGWPADDICIAGEKTRMSEPPSQRGHLQSQISVSPISFNEVDCAGHRPRSLPELSASRRDLNEPAFPLRHPKHKRVHRLSQVEIAELGLERKSSGTLGRAEAIPEVSRATSPIPPTKILEPPVTPPNREPKSPQATHPIEDPRNWETYSSQPSYSSDSSPNWVTHPSQPSYTPNGSPKRATHPSRPSNTPGNYSDWETTSSQRTRSPGNSSDWVTTSSEVSHSRGDTSRISVVRTDWGDSVIDLIEDLERDISFS